MTLAVVINVKIKHSSIWDKSKVMLFVWIRKSPVNPAEKARVNRSNIARGNPYRVIPAMAMRLIYIIFEIRAYK